MRKTSFCKRALSLFMCATISFTTFLNSVPTNANADSEEKYTLLLNDKVCQGETPLEISYGETMHLELQGVTEGSTVKYFYSKYKDFTDGDNTSFIDIVQDSSDFTKEIAKDASYGIGTTCYIAFSGKIGDKNDADTDGNHSFVIVPAEVDAPKNATLGEDFSVNFDKVTKATNDSTLDTDTITGYELSLFKDGEQIDADNSSDGYNLMLDRDTNSTTFADVISENGYGTYYYKVKPIISADAGTYYSLTDSSVNKSNELIYKDEIKPTITKTPKFTEGSQTIEFEAVDNESGITAFAVSMSESLDKSAEDWILIDNPGVGITVSEDILKYSFDKSNVAGEYYIFVKDAFDNITKADASITLNKILYMNDGKDSSVADTVHFFTGDSYSLKEPVRSGYDFSGWYLDEACTEEAPEEITVGMLSNGEYKVYGKWSFGAIQFSKQPNDGNDYIADYDGKNHKIKAEISNTTGNISYQWERFDIKANEWVEINDANTNEISIKDVKDSGEYRVVVTVTNGEDSNTASSEIIEVTVKPVSIDFIPDNKAVSYGGSKPEFTYSLSGLVDGETKDNVTVTAGTITCPAWEEASEAGTLPLAKGEYDIVASDFKIENYNVIFKKGVLTVGAYEVDDSKVNITIELSDYEYTYKEENGVSLDYKPEVVVKNNGNIVPTTEYEITYVDYNVAGTAKVIVTFKGNYSGTKTVNYTINKDSFDSEVVISGWMYGETASNPSVTTNVSGGAKTFYYEDSNHNSLGTTKPSNAGKYYVYAVIAATDNYAECVTDKKEFVISPRYIKLIAPNGEWDYDGNPHATGDLYYMEGDGFAAGDDFQSVIITGTIVNKGTMENKITYFLPDDIIASNYDIETKNGLLKVNEQALQIPGGITWSTDSSNLGETEWVPVVKTNLEIAYELQLYRRNPDGSYVAIGDKVKTTNANYNFADLIYEDAADQYFNKDVTDVVSYSFSVQAFPVGGSAIANYKLSSVSSYMSDSLLLGTNVVRLHKDEHITSVSAWRASENAPEISSTDSEFVIIQGEKIRTNASCGSEYKVASSVWTLNSSIPYSYYAAGNPYNNQTANDSYFVAPAKINKNDSYVADVTAHASDREPVIEVFSAEIQKLDNKEVAVFEIKASDGIALDSWILVKGLKTTIPTTGWNKEGISADGKTLDITKNITEEGDYYLFVKDTGNNIVGGWLYEDAVDYLVNKVYKITFDKGSETATGSMDYILKLEDENIIIPAVGFENPGKTFKNWQTKTNSILEDGAMYLLNQNDTLKAIWTEQQYTYTVRYHYEDIKLDENDNQIRYYKSDEELEEAGETLETQSFKAAYDETIDPALEKYKIVLKSKQGFVFDTDTTGTITVQDNDAVLDVYYKREIYKIRYKYENTENNTVIYPGYESYFYGQKVPDHVKPDEVAGYKFIGWTYDTLGAKPDTMPAQDITATGYYQAQTVKYHILYYYETLNSGEYALSPESEDRVATQGDEITMGTGDVFSTYGFTNSYVVAAQGIDNAMSSTLPAGAKTSATGIATAEEGKELYIVYYKTRNTYNLTLNVWKGDRLNGGVKLYTKSWPKKYGEAIGDASYYANYGKEDPSGAENNDDGWRNATSENLDEYILAPYEDWSTENAPSHMPFGPVVVSREYILDTLVPYNIDIMLENGEGEFESGGSVIYYAHLGETVAIGSGAGYTVDYNSLADTIAEFQYYKYVANDNQVLSGKVVDSSNDAEGEDSKLHLKIYFERKSYDVTVRYYDGIKKVFHEEVVKRKWGSKFTFDPDLYFDTVVTGDDVASRTYDTTNTNKNNVNTFRNKNYLVSYTWYYWDTNLVNNGNSDGHYSSKNIDTVDALKADYSFTVGMNNSSRVYIYYTEQDIDKVYYYNVGYNPKNLQMDKRDTFIPLEIADYNEPLTKYKIRVANKRDLYNVTPAAGDEDYSEYPGLALKKGLYEYGTVKSGFTEKKVEYKGKIYTFPVDAEGYIYIPNTSNQFYQGNRISFNYRTTSNSEIYSGGYDLAYSMVEDFLNQYKIEHSDDSDAPDPKGSSTAYIYNPGTDHICENASEGHNYTFTFYYNNIVTVTYSLGGNKCSAHNYYYNDTVTVYNTAGEFVGCSHNGVFPEREGYDIVWYMDVDRTIPATKFSVKGNTTIWGQYEKTILMNNEYLVFLLGESMTVGGVTYSDSLTEAQVLAIEAANDPEHVVSKSITYTNVEVFDTELQKTKTIKCENIAYKINDIPVLTNRKRPAICFSPVIMEVDEQPGASLNYYAQPGFRFDDTNVNNKIKGYTQYTPISLYAYYIRDNYSTSKERLLSDKDNPVNGLYSYGSKVYIEKLGTGTAYTKKGYDFAGWELFKTDSYDEEGNLEKIGHIDLDGTAYSEEGINLAFKDGRYVFNMPYYDTTIRAVWTPTTSNYDVMHYYQNESQSYNTALVKELLDSFEFKPAKFTFGSKIDVLGLVYLDGDVINGASLNYDDMVLYFADATFVKTEDEFDYYTLDEADLAGARTSGNYKSEEDYNVADTIINNVADITIFKYSNTSYEYKGDMQKLDKESKFTALPEMILENYYERATDYNIEALAIATDGKLADVTITGAGDCYYGQEITINASPAEGYVFKGWYKYNDIYEADGSFTDKYNNTFGNGEGTKLTPLTTTEAYDIKVLASGKYVAVVEAKDTTLPELSISGKTEYSYGYTYSATNALSVGVDMSGLDSAIYIKGYQWQLKKPGEDSYSDIEGATAANYIIPVGFEANSYDYACKVTISRKDNGREVVGTVEKKITVKPATLGVKESSHTYAYDGLYNVLPIVWPDGFDGYAADDYGGFEYYVSSDELTLDNYLDKYKTKFDHYHNKNGEEGYYSSSDYRYCDVKVDDEGNVTNYTNYIVIHDTKGNYEDILVTPKLTITPLTVTLKATSEIFTKVYDGNVDIDGDITEVGSEKRQIAEGTYYSIIGILGGEIETTMLDFHAEFNDAHVKNASAVYLTDIKVVYLDGKVDHNYIFADSYQLNIIGHITPFPLYAKWSDEREFVYNGELQGPVATLVEGSKLPPDGTNFSISVAGKQTNVGEYTAQAVVDDKYEDDNVVYYSSDYSFSSEGCPYKIVKKKIYVTPVDKTFTYNKQKHFLDSDVTVAGYTDNDLEKPITVSSGSKAGLVNDRQSISFEANKGYTEAGTYTDLRAVNIKIEEKNGVGDEAVVKSVTGNYDIYYGDGKMTINPKKVKLEGITAKDKIYDGNKKATLIYENEDGESQVTFNGLIEGDSLTYDPTQIKGTFINASVGNDKKVTISFTEDALGGESVDNYVLDTDDQYTTASITSKGLKVTADSLTVTYGEDIPYNYSCDGYGIDDSEMTITGTPVYKLYKLEEGEKVYYDSAKPDAGTYYIEVVTDGLSNSNYSISWNSEDWESQTLVVEKRKISVAASNNASPDNADATLIISKPYDGNNKALDEILSVDNFDTYYKFGKVNAQADTGIVSGDSVKLIIENDDFAATYNSKNVNAADKVSLSGYAIDNSNYQLVTPSFSIKGEITPLDLTITADSFVDDKALVYGTTEVEYTVVTEGFLASEKTEEEAKITFSSEYDPTVPSKRGDTSGTNYYKITPVYENDNYNITIVKGNIQVNKKEIEVTPIADSDIIFGIDIAIPDISPEYSEFAYDEDKSVITAGVDALNLNTSIDCEVTVENIKEKKPASYDMTYKSSVLAGLEASNYSFVSGEGTLKIVKQEISIAGITVNKKVYDGTTNVFEDNIVLDNDNVVVTYYIEGVKTFEVFTKDKFNKHFTISAKYKNKNAGTAKDVDLTIGFNMDEPEGQAFAAIYTFKTDGEDASQVSAKADIDKAPLTLTAKKRTIYFGDPLSFNKSKPGEYISSGVDGINDFVNGENFSDISDYGPISYYACDKTDPDVKYGIGSPAGEDRYKIVIGFEGDPIGDVLNYNVTFVNNDACVLGIDPATLKTPEPIWNVDKPGTVKFAAVPNIGNSPYYVRVDHYEVSLYKTSLEKDAASECTADNKIGTTVSVPYEEGKTTYEVDFASIIRPEDAGIYHVTVKAFASQVDNAAYCNVNKESKLGITEVGLYTTYVKVVFNPDDATSVAGEGTPAPGVGPSRTETYHVIAGESGVDIAATLKNATGYTVSSSKGAFVDSAIEATTANPVGITVTNENTAGKEYSGKLALSSSIKSIADREVILTLSPTPATLTLNLVLTNDHAMYGYSASAAPKFTVTASVSEDNVTEDGYTYSYEWFTKDGPMDSPSAVLPKTTDSASNTNTYSLATGKDVGDSYYYAYCTVTAKRKDNGKTIQKTTVKNIAASIDRAEITDSTVINAEDAALPLNWTYGEKRAEFTVSINPENAPVTFTYSDSIDGEYKSTKPVDVGNYYVKAHIAESDNYKEYDTEPVAFAIIRNKLSKPENIGMKPSDTAPYGLIYWDTVVGPKENAGLADSDMTIAVNYDVSFYYESAEGDVLLKHVVIDTPKYDFTSFIKKAGDYKVVVKAIVANETDLAKAQNNCADSDATDKETLINIGGEIECDIEGFEKIYDGQAMTLYVTYNVDGKSTYKWLKNGQEIEGATDSSYSVTYVEESATYTCLISPTGNGIYDVHTTAAEVAIKPRHVKISTKDASKVYDGTPLTYQNAKYEDGKTYSVEAMTSNSGIVYVSDDVYDEVSAISQGAQITTAKEGANSVTNSFSGVQITHKDNGVSKVVYDENDDSVVSNYIIDVDEGTLSVNKREIVITANSIEETYNGNPHTANGFVSTGTETVPSGLATGQVIKATVEGTRTIVGEVENVITAYSIKASADEDAADVTENYEVTIKSGLIKVTKADDTINVSISDKTYDSSPIDEPTVTKKGNGTVEIKYYSFEDKENALSEAPVNAGKYYVVATIKDSTNYKDASTDYVLFTIKQREIKLTADSGNHVYDGTAFTKNSFTVSATNTVPSGLVEGHKVYATVNGSLTNVAESPCANIIDKNSVVIKTAAEGGVDVTTNYKIITVDGTLKVTKADETISIDAEDMVYTDTAYTNPVASTKGDGAITYKYFDSDEQELTGAPVAAGSYYVCAYIKNSSNYKDADTGLVPFKILKRQVYIIPGSKTEKYTGNPLTDDSFTVTETEENPSGMVSGHIAEAVIVGSQTVVGSSFNIVDSAHIYNSDKSIELTDNYEIIPKKGTLTVVASEDTVTVLIDSKVYDGNPIDEPTILYISDGTLEVSYYDKNQDLISGRPTDVGIYYVNARVTGSNNYEDCESGLQVFEITKRPIRIVANSDSKVYDGEELSNSGYVHSGNGTAESGLVEGQKEFVTISGGQTDVGISDNEIISVVIKASEAEDAVEVTDNYQIIPENGKLEITPAEEKLELEITGKIHDAEEIMAPILSYIGDGTVTVKFYDSNYNELDLPPVNAGKYFVKAIITGSTNYQDAETDFVAFEIAKRELIITTADDMKTYDGKPLTNSNYTLSKTEEEESGLLESNIEYVTVDGSQTNAGSSENTVASVVIKTNVLKSTEEVTDNYAITIVPGTLTVNKAKDKIKIITDTMVYDGDGYDAYDVITKGDGQIEIIYYDNDKQAIDYVPTNVGNYYMQAKIKGSTNYEDAESDMVAFEIIKRKLTVTALSTERKYDGTALKYPVYEISEDESNDHGLVEGHHIIVSIDGSQTEVGSSENKITNVVILDSEASTAEDITFNYEITTIAGILTITEAEAGDDPSDDDDIEEGSTEDVSTEDTGTEDTDTEDDSTEITDTEDNTGTDSTEENDKPGVLTGDNTLIYLYWILCVMSGAGITWQCVTRRKKKEND